MRLDGEALRTRPAASERRLFGVRPNAGAIVACSIRVERWLVDPVVLEPSPSLPSRLRASASSVIPVMLREGQGAALADADELALHLPALPSALSALRDEAGEWLRIARVSADADDADRASALESVCLVGSSLRLLSCRPFSTEAEAGSKACDLGRGEVSGVCIDGVDGSGPSTLSDCSEMPLVWPAWSSSRIVCAVSSAFDGASSPS